MNASVKIDAGICGFPTTAKAASEDGQSIRFSVKSGCEKIRNLANAMTAAEPFDAYQEISPEAEGRFMAVCRESLKGCCAGCVVPAGLFKAMQVAAGLALPKGIHIDLEKEDGTG